MQKSNSGSRDSEKTPIILQPNQCIHQSISTFYQHPPLGLHSYLWWVHQLVLHPYCPIKPPLLLMELWFQIFRLIKQWLSIPTGSCHKWTRRYIDNIKKARDIALADGLDLKQIHKDQEPNFFINRGVIVGVARRFVAEIERWSDNYDPVSWTVYSRRGHGILVLCMYLFLSSIHITPSLIISALLCPA